MNNENDKAQNTRSDAGMAVDAERLTVLNVINEVTEQWYRDATPYNQGIVRGLRIELLATLGLPIEWPNGVPR